MEPKLIKKNIEEFIQYDDYIKEQVDKPEKLNNNNIVGLECRYKDVKIVYQESLFERLRDYINVYGVNTDSNSDSILLKNKSFCSIFNNNDNGYFLEESIIFIIDNIYDFYIHNMEIHENSIPLDFTNKIFSKGLDQELNDYYVKINSNPDKNQITNLDKYTVIFKKILSNCDQNKTVCSICYGKTKFVNHAVAIIFWKDEENKYSCGIYDPMYYERESGNYTSVVNLIYVILKLLSIKQQNINLTILNLSKFCVNDPLKGIHCSQYIIDAGYCRMYSLYFLFLYAKKGFSKNLDIIKTVVEETFIADNPIELKRNPCKATNKFRLVMMSFILTILTIISDDINALIEIRDIYETVLSDKYITNESNEPSNKISYSLLHPLMLTYLDNEILRLQGNSSVRRKNKKLPVKKIIRNNIYLRFYLNRIRPINKARQDMINKLIQLLLTKCNINHKLEKIENFDDNNITEFIYNIEKHLDKTNKKCILEEIQNNNKGLFSDKTTDFFNNYINDNSGINKFFDNIELYPNEYVQPRILPETPSSLSGKSHNSRELPKTPKKGGGYQNKKSKKSNKSNKSKNNKSIKIISRNKRTKKKKFLL